MEVVAQHLGLGQLRQVGRLLAEHRGRDERLRVADLGLELGSTGGISTPREPGRPSSITRGSSQTAAW